MVEVPLLPPKSLLASSENTSPAQLIRLATKDSCTLPVVFSRVMGM